MNQEDGAHYRRSAAWIAAFPIILKAAAFVFFVAAAIAFALGKISVVVGGGGLIGALVFALGSSVLQNHRLKQAIRESDRP